jgi:hypothetical protein
MPGRRRSRTVTLRRHVRLRPIAPVNKPLLIAPWFERLSEKSRYRRFFMNLRSCLPAMLAYFTEVDHSDREAIIAVEPTSGQALGVGRWCAGGAPVLVPYPARRRRRARLGNLDRRGRQIAITAGRIAKTYQYRPR